MKQMNIRFRVKHVPVPEGGHIVCDTFALPVRLHAGGVLYNRYERHQPHSAYYASHEDAQAVADWLVERAAGYPYNPLMAEWPNDSGPARLMAYATDVAVKS